ncbi:flagellar hook-associated protein 3 [Malaciobacter marinus]|uniref:flagellar hook-associated protein 3 n=1 Tax=Malaciobacter marinus TaxID=505249 RepID=UPI003B007664
MINSLSESMYRLDILNEKYERLNYQQSTKKKIDDGSDDSLVFTKEIYIEDKVSVFEGIKKQIEIIDAQNNSADSSVADIKDLMSTIKSEILRALDGTMDAESKKSIAINLEGMKKSILLFSNEQANGEYLFSGTNGGQAPFVEDPVTGKITYEGNGYLKKVAVEEGSYRERGVSGFDLMMNTVDEAAVGEKLNFSENQRIIDESGNEWVLNPAVPEIVKHTEMGATTETMPVTEILPSTTPKTYETTNPVAIPGQVLEAKENIFDILDTGINALRQVDSTGAPVTEAEAMDKLRETLENVNAAYDTINAAHTNLGVRNRIFEVSLEKVSSKLTHYNVLYQETAGANLAKVAMEAKALELTYTSLYTTINKANEMSLVNFVR